MTDINNIRLAVLIDAENVPYQELKLMLQEIAKYGTPTIKRIYADWTRPTGWAKDLLLNNALTPVQQYGYTVGKNSTDSAMIIDAMDFLYADNVGGFCIISSDSDFTPLALRLRESGKLVIGMGEKKTPKPFVRACDRFIYIENLRDASVEVENASNKDGFPEEVVKLIKTSINDIADENGWAFLGELGNLINKKQPDFDTRSYGYSKLTPLINKIKSIEIDSRDTNNPSIKHIFIRNK